ncbi:MAG TPA: hypothetical protein VIK01_10910 [Polyangiaceae bacterium]
MDDSETIGACARIEVAAREAALHAVDALEAPGVQVGLVLAGVIAKLQTVFAGVANPVREELALGKTEDWVTRKTGHCSSIMLAVDETQRHSVNMISIGSLSFTYLATLYSPGAPPST